MSTFTSKQAHLCGTGASGVGLRIGTPTSSELRQLCISKHQDAEQELSVELILLMFRCVPILKGCRFVGACHETRKGGFIVV